MKLMNTWIRLTVMAVFLFGLIGALATKPAAANDPFSATTIVDFNGDGKTDVTLVDSMTSQWHTYNFFSGAINILEFGPSDSRQVVGNYDRDTISDFAVCYNLDTGSKIWQIESSESGLTYELYWGLSTDIPVPRDYDGDSRTDIAVFRPSTGVWYIYLSSTNLVRAVQFGTETDKVVPADYDGDGTTDIAVMRLETRTWYVLSSDDNAFSAHTWDVPSEFGDIMIPADYDGDGIADYAAYEMKRGVWVILESRSGNYRTAQFGNGVYTGAEDPTDASSENYDLPMPGDFDGDGIMDLAVWSSRSRVVNVLPSQSSIMTSVPVGNVTSKPVSFSVVYE